MAFLVFAERSLKAFRLTVMCSLQNFREAILRKWINVMFVCLFVCSTMFGLESVFVCGRFQSFLVCFVYFPLRKYIFTESL